MIKAVFFDIDGTLVSHRDGTIPESTVMALGRLRQKGIKTFVATGRHMREMEEMPVNGLDFDGYVTLNGQICRNGGKTLLYDSPIHWQDTAKMVSVFERRDIPVMVVEGERMYINFIDESVRRAQRAISTPVPETGIYGGGSVYQFILFAGEKKAEQIVGQLPNCKMTRWNENAVDIIPKSGGKVAGIRQILHRFQLGADEIMAFGDGENDIDMLRFAGVGIAMDNGDEDVKKQADYITDSVDRHGIWKALEHYGLL